MVVGESIDGYGELAQERSLRDLLAEASEGSWAAWDEIIRRFSRLVLHIAARIGLSHSDAADVAQLTWLRLLEHGHQIREPDCLPGWLVSTARRESIRVAAASRRCVPCADPATEYGERAKTAVLDVYPVDGEFGPVVEEALSRLPARYQTLLRLLASDRCLRYAEIAEEMDVPVGSVGPMRMRALRMLANTPEFRSGEVGWDRVETDSGVTRLPAQRAAAES
ncbi:MAG: RNA polymerase sigma factor [Frankiaceae bacterium]